MFEFSNWHLMRGRLMLPDSFSAENLKIDWKMKIYKLGHFGAGCSGVIRCLQQNGLAWRSSIFQLIFNFSSEMESDNVSPPLIKYHLQNSKILKHFITLIMYKYFILIYCGKIIPFLREKYKRNKDNPPAFDLNIYFFLSWISKKNSQEKLSHLSELF